MNNSKKVSTITKRSMLGLPTEFVAPRSSIEQHVGRIWREEFRLDEIGINDDFFDLSGDSLTATGIAAVVSSEFKAKFQPGMLMTYSTVAMIADYLEKQSNSNRAQAVQRDWPLNLVPVRTEGTLPPLFVIHGRFGISFPRKSFIDGLSSEQPLYFIQAIGYMGEASPPRSIAAIATKYLETIRLVQPEGPLNIASFCAGGLIALEIVRQSASAGDPLAGIIMVDPPVPYVLQGRFIPPVVRTAAYSIRERWRELRTKWGIRSDNRVVEKLEAYKERHPAANRYNPEVIKNAQEVLFKAFIHYRPEHFTGRVDILASRQYFEDDARWQPILPNRNLHIIGDTHRELLKTNAGETARRLQQILIGNSNL